MPFHILRGAVASRITKDSVHSPLFLLQTNPSSFWRYSQSATSKFIYFPIVLSHNERLDQINLGPQVCNQLGSGNLLVSLNLTFEDYFGWETVKLHPRNRSMW